jgi:hypoxanthine phosphoribosyltransferase
MKNKTDRTYKSSIGDFSDIILLIGLCIIPTFIFWLIETNQISPSIEKILLLISGITIALAIESFQEVLSSRGHIRHQQETDSNPISVFESNNTDSDFSKFIPEPRQSKILIEPHEVQSDGVLSTSSTVLGVISLEVFARKHTPRYIVGVNRGGWLLSTYLAHRLNIDRDSLFRFDANKDDITDNNINTFFSDIKKDIEINILLVDDISRSGNSVHKAVDCIKKRFPLCHLSVAVLVVCGRKSDKIIDYHPYWTQHEDIQLPWSSDERKKEARKRINAQEKVVIVGDKDSLGHKGSVLRIADSFTKDGEEFDISNDDIKIVLEGIEKFYCDSEEPI